MKTTSNIYYVQCLSRIQRLNCVVRPARGLGFFGAIRVCLSSRFAALRCGGLVARVLEMCGAALIWQGAERASCACRPHAGVSRCRPTGIPVLMRRRAGSGRSAVLWIPRLLCAPFACFCLVSCISNCNFCVCACCVCVAVCLRWSVLGWSGWAPTNFVPLALRFRGCDGDDAAVCPRPCVVHVVEGFSCSAGGCQFCGRGLRVWMRIDSASRLPGCACNRRRNLV